MARRVMRDSMLSSIVINSLGTLIPPLTSLVVQPVLARSLGVVGRGEVAAAIAPLTVATALLGFGMPEAFTHYVARTGSRHLRVLRLGFCLLAVGGVLGAILVWLLSDALSAGDEHLAYLITLTSLAIGPSLLVSGLRGVFAGEAAWGLVAGERTVSAMLRLLAVCLLAATGQLSEISAALAIGLSGPLGAIVYLPSLLRGPTNVSSGDDVLPRHLLGYAGAVWSGSVAGISLARIDQVLLTPLAGSYELGIYAVAVSLGEVALVFNSAVREVLFAAESGAPDGLRVGQAARVSTLITGIGGFVICALGAWLIPVAFGPGFEAVVPVLVVVTASVIVGNPGAVAGIALIARGMPGLRSMSLAWAAVANLLLLVALAPVSGAMGAAVATLLSGLLTGCINIMWVQRKFQMHWSQFVFLNSADIQVLRNVSMRLFSRSTRARRDHETS